MKNENSNDYRNNESLTKENSISESSSQDCASLNLRLKHLREAKGLSVRDFAKAINVPESTYREWEYGRGLRMPPISKISEVLQISITEILTGQKPDLREIEFALSEIETAIRDLRSRMSILT